MAEQPDMSDLSDDKKMELLEKFLMEIGCLDELDKWSSRANIFDILSVSSMEIRHSNFLSWLLDPHENHGLGDYFLKRFLQFAARIYGRDNSPISIVNIDSMDLDDVLIFRELYNIDVLIVSESNSFDMIIENKIRSTEHSDQLNRYRTLICKKYPEHRHFFVYLTLDGERPSDEHWVPISYEFVQSLVKSILQNKDLPARPRMYLEDYFNTLAGELMNDEELRKTCMQIYNAHRDAIDLIIQNLPNDQSIMYDHCKALLDEYADNGKIIMLTTTKAAFKFTTPRIRAKVGCVGNDSWCPDKDLIAYDVYTTLGNYPNVSLYIGPGEEKYRKAWYEYLRTTDIYTVKRKSYSPQWTAIFKDYENEVGEKGIDSFISKLAKHLENLDKIDAIIEAGPQLD